MGVQNSTIPQPFVIQTVIPVKIRESSLWLKTSFLLNYYLYVKSFG